MLFIILLMAGTPAYLQINLTQLKTTVDPLPMPFETPAWLPRDGWEGEIEFKYYSFSKNNITELYAQNHEKFKLGDVYYAAGYLELGEATALIYLKSHLEEKDSLRHYSVCMDTYGQKGLLLESTVLSEVRFQQEDIFPIDNDPFSVATTVNRNARIYFTNQHYYFTQTIETDISHNYERELFGDYFTDTQVVSERSQTDLVYIRANGQLAPVQNDAKKEHN